MKKKEKGDQKRPVNNAYLERLYEDSVCREKRLNFRRFVKKVIEDEDWELNNVHRNAAQDPNVVSRRAELLYADACRRSYEYLKMSEESPPVPKKPPPLPSPQQKPREIIPLGPELTEELYPSCAEAEYFAMTPHSAQCMSIDEWYSGPQQESKPGHDFLMSSTEDSTLSPSQKRSKGGSEINISPTAQSKQLTLAAAFDKRSWRSKSEKQDKTERPSFSKLPLRPESLTTAKDPKVSSPSRDGREPMEDSVHAMMESPSKRLSATSFHRRLTQEDDSRHSSPERPSLIRFPLRRSLSADKLRGSRLFERTHSEKVSTRSEHTPTVELMHSPKIQDTEVAHVKVLAPERISQISSSSKFSALKKLEQKDVLEKRHDRLSFSSQHASKLSRSASEKFHTEEWNKDNRISQKSFDQVRERIRRTQ